MAVDLQNAKGFIANKFGTTVEQLDSLSVIPGFDSQLQRGINLFAIGMNEGGNRVIAGLEIMSNAITGASADPVAFVKSAMRDSVYNGNIDLLKKQSVYLQQNNIPVEDIKSLYTSYATQKANDDAAYAAAQQGGGGLFGDIGKFFASIDPSTAISRELTNLYQPVEKAITAGVEEVSKALSTDDAKKAMAIAAAYYLPGVGVELGSILKAQGLITGAAIPYATAIGTALASTGASVAQGVPFDTALTNATVNAVTSTGSQSVAGYISKLGASPEVANAVTSVGASGLATAAKGGSAADIERNMTGALAGSTITSMTGDKITGAAVGGQITGGTTGALLGAAGAAGARDAKEGATTTTAPTTQATLTQDLTDAQVSQIQNALGISVSDATNNDVKLALGPLLAPLGAGAAIVSDSVIPLIGIFGAKAVSDTIDYFKAQNDSSGFYRWVNENMQAADDRVQNKLSLNPAGAGRGFVNPPVATPITPSQAAVSGSYNAGFSGAGGGAGAGVTAGEATAGEAEARDFLVAQKVTNPEIDFETLAREPALNEPPTDQKIIDLIQPGVASTPATTPPGTTPTDRDILNFSGITQPGTSTVTPSTAVTQPTTVTPQTATPVTFTPAIAKIATPAIPQIFTPAIAIPAVPPAGETDAERTARIDAYIERTIAGEQDYYKKLMEGRGRGNVVVGSGADAGGGGNATSNVVIDTGPGGGNAAGNVIVSDGGLGGGNAAGNVVISDGGLGGGGGNAAGNVIVGPGNGGGGPGAGTGTGGPGTGLDDGTGLGTGAGDGTGTGTGTGLGDGTGTGPGDGTGTGDGTGLGEDVVVDEPPVDEDEPPVDEDEPPEDEDKPPEDEDKPPGEKEDEYKPDLFVYGGKTPKPRPRTRTDLGTTLQGPFAPSTTLGQALTGYRGAGEIEGKKTGKPRKNVWNEESLRLKDALGL